MRTATIQRDTKETRIGGSLKIEGRGQYSISTGIRFFDHMLELFTKHGGFDLKLDAKGDLDVDQHHTVEDVGIVLGELFAKALGDRRGINRAGYFVLPMDETLAVVALDLGGRPALVYRDLVRVRLVGDLQAELVEFRPGSDPVSAAPPRPWGHPDLVLAAAVRASVICAADAELISATRLGDTDLAEAAERLGLSYWACHKRRRRAESALVEWVTGDDYPPFGFVQKRAETPCSYGGGRPRQERPMDRQPGKRRPSPPRR